MKTTSNNQPIKQLNNQANNQQPQNQTESQKSLLLQIDSKLIEAVFQTLVQLPYGQVEPLMTALRNDLAKNNPQ